MESLGFKTINHFPCVESFFKLINSKMVGSTTPTYCGNNRSLFKLILGYGTTVSEW